MIKIIIILIGSIISAKLYRMGGSDRFNTKVRDLGVPLVTTVIFLLLGIRSWWFVLHYGLLALAMTTYWKRLNKLFGKPDSDCYWFNWLATGLAYGLCALVLYSLFPMHKILSRTIVLGICTMFWSEFIDNVVWEERGRGALVQLTLLFLVL